MFGAANQIPLVTQGQTNDTGYLMGLIVTDKDYEKGDFLGTYSSLANSRSIWNPGFWLVRQYLIANQKVIQKLLEVAW